MICQMRSLESKQEKSANETINTQRTKEEIEILQKMIKTLKKRNKKPTVA